MAKIQNPGLAEKHKTATAQLAKAKAGDREAIQARITRLEQTDADMQKGGVEHAKRLLKDIGGMTLTGVRLSDPDDGARGMVVTLAEGEAKPVVDAIRKVLQARTK